MKFITKSVRRSHFFVSNKRCPVGKGWRASPLIVHSRTVFDGLFVLLLPRGLNHMIWECEICDFSQRQRAFSWVWLLYQRCEPYDFDVWLTEKWVHDLDAAVHIYPLIWLRSYMLPTGYAEKLVLVLSALTWCMQWEVEMKAGIKTDQYAKKLNPKAINFSINVSHLLDGPMTPIEIFKTSLSHYVHLFFNTCCPWGRATVKCQAKKKPLVTVSFMHTTPLSSYYSFFVWSIFFIFVSVHLWQWKWICTMEKYTLL